MKWTPGLRVVVSAIALASPLFLVSCGGGGGGSPMTMDPPDPEPPRVNPFDRGQATTAHGYSGITTPRASNEPINTDPTESFVFVGGVNPVQMLTESSRNCTQQRCYPDSLHTIHEGTEIGHVRIRDGVSANSLLRYLQADADDTFNRVVRWSTPPVVRMVQGSTEEDSWHTELAIRLINSALPADWQLRFDSTLASREARLDPGVIKVAFAPREEWPSNICSGGRVIGCGVTDIEAGRVTAGAALVDPTRTRGERHRVFVLLHEILHTLGRGHVSPSEFRDTIMHAAGDQGVSEFLILNRLDEAALYAIYDRLSAGTPAADINYESLGPWSDVSTHVFGRIGYVPGRYEAVIFGSVWQNGNVRPYVAGLYPAPALADGPRTGSASWSGRMIGLTPQAEPVAGAVDMSIQLSSLRGTVDFTELEQWAAQALPGHIGTGTQWGDGDLNYRIAVQGYAFHETGGDAGKVTGTFYGPNQDKAGGTLRRTDLAAGFGAERQ